MTSEFDQSDRTEHFLSCFTKEQRSLYALIRSLVFDSAEVEEVFQETSLAIWRDFDRFTPGTDFGAWARQIARNRVLAHSKRQRGDRHRFSVELVAELARESEQSDSQLEERRVALRKCLGRLSEENRHLIQERYSGARSVADLAQNRGSTAGALYKKLSRIRQQLIECTDRAVKKSINSLPGSADPA